MALEDAICLGGAVEDVTAISRKRSSAIRTSHRAHGTRAISSLMMDKLNHAKGVERKVRNSLFEGRTPEESYDRMAWLYTPPAYVK